MGRTNVEQGLKREIGEKNALTRRLRERLQEISRYRRRAGEEGGHRWRKRYAATAGRLDAEARALAAEVLRRGEDLERRIHEELRISEGEIADFKQRYEKELAEYREAHRKAKIAVEDWELAKRSWKAASKAEQDRLRTFEAESAQARAQESKEKKDAEKLANEQRSEARDKAHFTLELARIAAERAGLKRS